MMVAVVDTILMAVVGFLLTVVEDVASMAVQVVCFIDQFQKHGV